MPEELSTGELRRELGVAVATRQFELHYQPIVRLDTCELNSLEALLRWRIGDDAWIPPSTFVPLLEQMGLIAEVGEWIFDRAQADCEYWRSNGRCVRRVAINVSPLQLRGRRSLAALREKCRAWVASDTRLEIELTESAFLDDSKELIQTLEKLAASGVAIALDDFGCGYSSLRLLSFLPVCRLKIDASFTRQLACNLRARVIVDGIIRLSESLGIGPVGEGIETSEQLSILRELGCEFGQGFLCGPARSREDLLPFLPQSDSRHYRPSTTYSSQEFLAV